MKATIAGLIVLALTVGTIWFLAPRTPDREPAADQAPQTRSDGRKQSAMLGSATPQQPGASLDRRVTKLERDVSAIRQQLRLRPGTLHGVPSASTTTARPASTNDPEFFDAVREIVDALREEEQETRREFRRQRITEMTDQTLNDLQDSVQLNHAQRVELGSLWLDEADRVSALIRAARDGEQDFSEVRAEVRKLREETDSQAREVLSQEQFEKYLEVRPAGRGGRRGPPPP